jgi:ABC-type antimicrobial peptide transport system permease subunit
MKRLALFVRHAVAHLSRERQRTLFVLFCIAAGVAAVVSLRTLGLMVTDALDRDLQMANRGDIAIGMPDQVGESDTGSPRAGEGTAEDEVDKSLFKVRGDPGGSQNISLSRSGEARLQAWASERGFEAMPLWTNLGPFARIHKRGEDTAAESVMVLCIDQARYPFYGAVHVLSPAGATLAEALSGAQGVAVTDELAEILGLRIGDRVHLTGAAEMFSVAAVVSPRSEASLIDPLYATFPFVYLPYQTCLDVLRERPNKVYVRVPPGTDVHAVKQEIMFKFRGLQPTTTEDLRQVNRRFSETLIQLVTVMGLVSLLIGGIGIANTMIVVVTRRTLEVAVLKTIGVQGGQITLMFMIEALILGTVGSLLGIPLGLGLVMALQRSAERFVAQTVQFTIYPEALEMGLALGMVVTVVFGLLPTLSAGRVRPNLVLRPAEAAVPRAGRLASLLVLLGLTACMGVIVGQIVGDVLTGVLAAYATVLVLGLALLALRAVVWVISHLPTFGIVPLKLSQRAMSAYKGRVANTLLALVTGIFCLSLVWLLVWGTIQLVTDFATTFLGGNVMVVVESLADGKALERKVARLPDVTFKHDIVYVAEVVAVNGDEDVEAFKRRAKAAAAGASVVGDPNAIIDRFVSAFDMKVLSENTWDYQVVQGEDIAGMTAVRASPTSEVPILLEPRAYDGVLAWFGLKPGDTLTLRFPSGATRNAVIVGITAPHEAGYMLQGLLDFRFTYGIVPPRFVPRGELPRPSVYILNVPPERMGEILDALFLMPGVYTVETEQFIVYTERFAGQFAPLPVIVSGLALFASGVIIANTVSLSTLERRRQIGIMRAVGLQATTVLSLLLLENGVVGLAGGLIGTGLSALLILLLGILGEGDIPTEALGLLILLAVGLALGATTLTAYGASREKPMNVLRYE